MKVTNDFHNRIGKAQWTHDKFNTAYLTDDVGVMWEIRSTKYGLMIRSLGSTRSSPGIGNDSIRVQPMHTNEIRLRSVRIEEP